MSRHSLGSYVVGWYKGYYRTRNKISIPRTYARTFGPIQIAKELRQFSTLQSTEGKGVSFEDLYRAYHQWVGYPRFTRRGFAKVLSLQDELQEYGIHGIKHYRGITLNVAGPYPEVGKVPSVRKKKPPEFVYVPRRERVKTLPLMERVPLANDGMPNRYYKGVARFLEDCCILDDGIVDSKGLYADYKMWCSMDNRHHIYVDRKGEFTHIIRELGFDTSEYNRKVHGLSMKPDAIPVTDMQRVWVRPRGRPVGSKTMNRTNKLTGKREPIGGLFFG